eukprot:734881-Rhodomonas_salina.2
MPNFQVLNTNLITAPEYQYSCTTNSITNTATSTIENVAAEKNRRTRCTLALAPGTAFPTSYV